MYDINYRVLKLINIQISDKIYKNYEKTIDKLKPPIFWKDKSVFLQQLKKWDLEKLNKLANKIAETEILMKKNSQINNSIIIKNFIVALSTEVSTASSF